MDVGISRGLGNELEFAQDCVVCSYVIVLNYSIKMGPILNGYWMSIQI